MDLLFYENYFHLRTITHKNCRNNENYKCLCRGCLNTCGDQTKFKKHMLRCIEQEVGNISFMHPNQKNKLVNTSYMKTDPPKWIEADFEFLNVPVDELQVVSDADSLSHAGSTNEKFLVSKSVAIDYIIVKNPQYENLNLEKTGYEKQFGENCVELSVNEMLEMET